MDLMQFVKQLLELTEEERYTLLRMVASTCPNAIRTNRKHVFVPMNKDIVDDVARAKEYVRITKGEIDSKMYSSMNWGQYYKKLVNDGCLISTSEGTLMRLEMDLFKWIC